MSLQHAALDIASNWRSGEAPCLQLSEINMAVSGSPLSSTRSWRVSTPGLGEYKTPTKENLPSAPVPRLELARVVRSVSSDESDDPCSEEEGPFRSPAVSVPASLPVSTPRAGIPLLNLSETELGEVDDDYSFEGSSEASFTSSSDSQLVDRMAPRGVPLLKLSGISAVNCSDDGDDGDDGCSEASQIASAEASTRVSTPKAAALLLEPPGAAPPPSLAPPSPQVTDRHQKSARKAPKSSRHKMAKGFVKERVSIFEGTKPKKEQSVAGRHGEPQKSTDDIKLDEGDGTGKMQSVLLRPRSEVNTRELFGPRYGPARAMPTKTPRVLWVPKVEGPVPSAPEGADPNSESTVNCGSIAEEATEGSLGAGTTTPPKASSRAGPATFLISTPRSGDNVPTTHDLVENDASTVEQTPLADLREPLWGLSRGELAQRVHRLTATRRTRAVCICTAGGATVAATVGGAVGISCGAALGATAGMAASVPTLGLSVPVGAVIGSAVGLGGGLLAGGGVGALGSGACSLVAIAVDIVGGELYGGLLYLRGRLRHSREDVLIRVAVTEEAAATPGAASATSCGTARESFAQSLRSGARSSKLGVVTVSAVGGAAVLGPTGAAVGTVLGGVAGAAIGLVPALFTFGLSIPVGVVLGSGTGFCAGTAAGVSGGLATGGALGYGSHALCSERIGTLWSRVRATRRIQFENGRWD